MLTPHETQHVVLPARENSNRLQSPPNGRFLASVLVDTDALASIQLLYPTSEWRLLATSLGLTNEEMSRIQQYWKCNPIRVNLVCKTIQVWMERNDCFIEVLRNAFCNLGYDGCAGFVQRLWEGPAID